jgi:hypothetical protein
MSAGKYAAPLRLDPRRSRRLAVAVILSVAGAALCPFMLPLSWMLRGLALAAVATVAHGVYRHHFGSERIVRAVWDELGQWRLWLANGTESDVQLLGDSFVTPEVMILNFSEGRRRFHLVVLHDALDPDTLRRLRVRLMLEGLASLTTPTADRSSSPI